MLAALLTLDCDRMLAGDFCLSSRQEGIPEIKRQIKDLQEAAVLLATDRLKLEHGQVLYLLQVTFHRYSDTPNTA